MLWTIEPWEPSECQSSTIRNARRISHKNRVDGSTVGSPTEGAGLPSVIKCRAAGAGDDDGKPIRRGWHLRCRDGLYASDRGWPTSIQWHFGDCSVKGLAELNQTRRSTPHASETVEERG
jgi:hypothetical protein